MLRHNGTAKKSGSARVHKMGGLIGIDALETMKSDLEISSSITLRGVGLNPAGAQILGAAIATNNELAVLSLGNNELGDEGVGNIVASLAVNTEAKPVLTTLSLDENGISALG